MKCFMTHQDCIYEKEIHEKQSPRSLFVVSPFGYPYDEIYDNIIAPAGQRAGIKVQRADVVFQLGFVMCTKICKLLQQATYVVADLTEDNPNVFYELGLAWGFGKKIVIMRNTDVPRSTSFKEILALSDHEIVSYKELLDIREQLPQTEPVMLELLALPNNKIVSYRDLLDIQEQLPEQKPIKVELLAFPDDKVVSYQELLGIRERLQEQSQEQLLQKEPITLSTFISKAIDVRQDYGVAKFSDPGQYIQHKHICVCHRAEQPDGNLYMIKIRDAIAEVNKVEQSRKGNAPPKPWDLEQVVFGGGAPPDSRKDKSGTLADSLPRKFASSKVVIVDVTHYGRKPDVSMYFALGLSHAMDRGTIPITNQARYDDNSPFDVRGLWQVYFKKLEQLKTGLVGIFTGILSREYETERQTYPLHFIWNKVLSQHGELTVITCARGAKGDIDREGGRTHVDKWDYASVAKLASYLAKEYRQASMKIEPPKEKANLAKLDPEARSRRADEIAKRLCDPKDNNLIIVGSPDVNDYAEIVLARIYEIDPYQREQCRRTDDDPLREKCWKCEEKENSRCLGQRGYLFYKKTLSNVHARKTSHFFRDPPADEGECVAWYGQQHKCTGGRNSETFGVLTLFKDRKDLFGRDDRWIILLSGFTGVATHELAKMLTTLDVKNGQGDVLLQEALEEKGIKLEERGVQVLISINYTSDYKPGTDTRDYDPRNPQTFKIQDIQPLFESRAQGAY